MSKVSERLGYIRGMMEGLKLNKEDDTVKLLGSVVDVLDELSSIVARLEVDQQELNDYVESIDDDLAELEMEHKDDEGFGDFDDDDFEPFEDDSEPHRDRAKLSVLRNDEDEDYEEIDDDEDLFIGCVCSSCGKFFAVCNPDDYDDEQKFECPFCLSHVSISPIDPEGVPTAKPVD